MITEFSVNERRESNTSLEETWPAAGQKPQKGVFRHTRQPHEVNWFKPQPLAGYTHYPPHPVVLYISQQKVN